MPSPRYTYQSAVADSKMSPDQIAGRVTSSLTSRFNVDQIRCWKLLTTTILDNSHARHSPIKGKGRERLHPVGRGNLFDRSIDSYDSWTTFGSVRLVRPFWNGVPFILGRFFVAANESYFFRARRASRYFFFFRKPFYWILHVYMIFQRGQQVFRDKILINMCTHLEKAIYTRMYFIVWSV